jgi:UDP-N-acetyl-D-galactosamine dehydrogenase
MIAAGSFIKGAKVNVLGLTFKENCGDLRNSKVIDIINELRTYGVNVHVHDPLASSAECEHEYGIHLTPWEQLPKAQALIAAVSHRQYAEMPLAQLTSKLASGGVFVDVKSAYDPAALRELGLRPWRL